MTIDEQTKLAAATYSNNEMEYNIFLRAIAWERERAKKLLEWPCVECRVGEMKQKGYTSPSGLTTYECDRCGHEETYP